MTLDTIQNVDNNNPPGSGFANFVTIYDFGTSSVSLGDLTGSLVGWLGTSALTNTGAFNTTHTDDPTLWNFRLTAPFPTFIAGPATIGTFTLHSSLGPDSEGFRIVSADGQAFQTVLPLGQHGNIGTTIAPVPGPILGGGLTGLLAACGGILALARRRRQQVA